METKKQIQIIRELLEATKELNGEYQSGWDVVIQEGENLLEYLTFTDVNQETKK